MQLNAQCLFVRASAMEARLSNKEVRKLISCTILNKT